MTGEAREAFEALLLKLSTRAVADGVLGVMDECGPIKAFGLDASSGGATLTWSSRGRNVVFTVGPDGGASHTAEDLQNELNRLFLMGHSRSADKRLAAQGAV